MSANDTVSQLLETSTHPAFVWKAGSNQLTWKNPAFQSLLQRSALNELEFLKTISDKLPALHPVGSAIVSLPRGKDQQEIYILTHMSLLSPEFEQTNSLIFLTLPGASGTPPGLPNEEVRDIMHDLKNPLSAIFGYTDTLLDTQVGDNLSPEHRKILGHIRHTSIRSIEMIKNVEQLYWITQPGLNTAIRENDLNACIEAVLESFRPAHEAQTTVTLWLSSASLMIPADRIQLERIVANLLSNAYKYTPPEGRIFISTLQQGDRAIFKIRNTQSYLSPDECAKLFKKYSRLSNSVAHAGSGLGLFIVKSLVERLGGKVEVSSSKETGTEFVVNLPCLNTPEAI